MGAQRRNPAAVGAREFGDGCVRAGTPVAAAAAATLRSSRSPKTDPERENLTKPGRVCSAEGPAPRRFLPFALAATSAAAAARSDLPEPAVMRQAHERERETERCTLACNIWNQQSLPVGQDGTSICLESRAHEIAVPWLSKSRVRRLKSASLN